MDDLINTSGSWERRLASISNNIPGLVTSLGGGAGLAGTVGIVTTAFIALAPAIKGAWDYFMDTAPEVAKERLKEIEQQALKLHEAFLKLASHPRPAESEEAQNLASIFGDRPNAETIKRGLMGGLGHKSVMAAADEKELAELGKLKDANLTDADIEGESGATSGCSRTILRRSGPTSSADE